MNIKKLNKQKINELKWDNEKSQQQSKKANHKASRST